MMRWLRLLFWIALAVVFAGLAVKVSPLFLGGSLLALIMAFADVIGQWGAQAFADWFVDFIYSARGPAADVAEDDHGARAAAERFYNLGRTAFFLLMAAALYGLYWGLPGLAELVDFTELKPIGRETIARIIVCLAAAVLWAAYLFGSFLPRAAEAWKSAWFEWRYREPAPDEDE